jgi:hypothetical protein
MKKFYKEMGFKQSAKDKEVVWDNQGITLPSAIEKEPVQSKEVPGTDQEGSGESRDSSEDDGEEPTVFQGDLQLPIEVSDDDVQPPTLQENNEVLQTVLENTAKAWEKMMKKYTKNHTIETFVAGDIVTVKLPCDVCTSTDNKKLFAWVLGQPKPNRYKLQTEYGVIERLMSTKELERVGLSMDVEVNSPSKKIALSRAAIEASTSKRVVISYKYKGKCNTKQCRCFKEQKKCSVHCHRGDGDYDCGFLSSLAVRTEKALASCKRARANTAGDVVGSEVEQ